MTPGRGVDGTGRRPRFSPPTCRTSGLSRLPERSTCADPEAARRLRLDVTSLRMPDVQSPARNREDAFWQQIGGSAGLGQHRGPEVAGGGSNRHTLIGAQTREQLLRCHPRPRTGSDARLLCDPHGTRLRTGWRIRATTLADPATLPLGDLHRRRLGQSTWWSSGASTSSAGSREVKFHAI